MSAAQSGRQGLPDAVGAESEWGSRMFGPAGARRRSAQRRLKTAPANLRDQLST